ncbi:MAG: hypothetical protein ACOZQL_06635 [Myxococcota bacterium]
MSWRTIGPEQQFFTGDLPLDEFTRATQRIAAAYRERFGRPPVLAELLHALRVVLQADEELLADPARLAADWPELAFPATAPPRLDEYEGSFADEPAPHGTHFVARRATGEDVLECRLWVEGRTLFVDYAVLTPPLDEALVRALVGWVLLRQYARDHYRPLVDEVSWASAEAPQLRKVTPYP